MTKVIDLTQTEPKEGNKIEFVKVILEDRFIDIASSKPSEWQNIELICHNYKGCLMDLMFAYDGDRSYGCLYLGHFNDGIV